MRRNMYCPRCGSLHIEAFQNNQPVADFFCPGCGNEYELKSTSGKLGTKITDGAYDTMIERITGNDNPDFFFLTYLSVKQKVNDLIFIPKHFFVPEMIEKRKPLSVNARRAGWVGCNILIDKIPEQGRVSIIAGGEITDKNSVLAKVSRSGNLEVKNINSRGWLMSILNCVNRIPDTVFTLKEMYQFEDELKLIYPENNNIQAKIRQQLQFLRDKGVLEFLGRGQYKKVV